MAALMAMAANAQGCAGVDLLVEAFRDYGPAVAVEVDVPGGGRDAFEGCADGTGAEGDLVCTWAYGLRDAEAAALEEALGGMLSPCMEAVRDVGVNHPDTSRITRFEAPGYAMSLSYKDKAALGATFVTLRVFLGGD